MLPREPPRRPQLGFLYLPPYRVQGVSIAGEESVVQVPELDICFDIGRCPRAALASNFVALTHGHMDHAAGIAYYFSQRSFQGMGEGTVLCHPSLEAGLVGLMEAWVQVERQRTPHKIVPLEPGALFELKNRIFLKGFETVHTVPSMGFVVVEHRSKLKAVYQGLPQSEIVKIKETGTQITDTHEIPLVCYTGDTAWGPHFERADVLGAKILITECTFTEPGHRKRAGVGKHLHLDHIVRLLEASTAEAVVLTHLSRRTNAKMARDAIRKAIPTEHQERVFVLMDRRENRERYERQVAEADETQSV